MNRTSKLFAIALFGMLVACGTMKVEDPIQEAMPSDFDPAEYFSINRDVGLYQVREAITALRKPRVDSMASTNDSLSIANISNPAKANETTDTAAFFADTAFAHYVYVNYALYPESSWNPDSLWALLGNSSAAIRTPIVALRKMMLLFNLPDLDHAANRAYLDNFVFDYDLISMQFQAFGFSEGRPYRYCNADDDRSTPKDTTQSVANSRGERNYKPNAYCLDSTLAQTFLIQP